MPLNVTDPALEDAVAEFGAKQLPPLSKNAAAMFVLAKALGVTPSTWECRIRRTKGETASAPAPLPRRLRNLPPHRAPVVVVAGDDGDDEPNTPTRRTPQSATAVACPEEPIGRHIDTYA